MSPSGTYRVRDAGTKRAPPGASGSCSTCSRESSSWSAGTAARCGATTSASTDAFASIASRIAAIFASAPMRPRCDADIRCMSRSSRETLAFAQPR